MTDTIVEVSLKAVGKRRLATVFLRCFPLFGRLSLPVSVVGGEFIVETAEKIDVDERSEGSEFSPEGQYMEEVACGPSFIGDLKCTKI